MSGAGCGSWCQFCGKCSIADDRDTAAARDFIETCSHPAHWRSDAGGCRLCDASEATLTRQARQRGLQQPLPLPKSA